MMIVGNGLIARVFKSGKYDWSKMIIFASGVSNSTETRSEEFDRERKLLSSIKEYGLPVIYFSTISVYDTKSQYANHKEEMELLVGGFPAGSIIMRLPIVVGSTNNSSQLFGYLRNCLSHSLPITIFKNASRYLLDIDDLEEITKAIADWSEEKKKTHIIVDVVFSNPIPMVEIARYIMNKYVGQVVEILEEGSMVTVKGELLATILSDRGTKGLSTTPIEILEKYL